MTLTFIEYEGFTRAFAAYFGSDDAYAAFQKHSLEEPARGVVMQGCGGLRLIYLYVPEAHTVAFLDVYDKDDAEDLTQEQRRVLAYAAGQIRDELLKQDKPA